MQLNVKSSKSLRNLIFRKESTAEEQLIKMLKTRQKRKIKELNRLILEHGNNNNSKMLKVVFKNYYNLQNLAAAIMGTSYLKNIDKEMLEVVSKGITDYLNTRIYDESHKFYDSLILKSVHEISGKAGYADNETFFTELLESFFSRTTKLSHEARKSLFEFLDEEFISIYDEAYQTNIGEKFRKYIDSKLFFYK